LLSKSKAFYRRDRREEPAKVAKKNYFRAATG
jgi:hypothetical protein